MDNWLIKTFIWYRSQHSDARWPFKWWIRFHLEVTKDEVKALSLWMTFKCAVANLPLWWAKWWIIVNPKELSEWELERLSRGYVRELYKYIWPEQDIPAPDVNTNSKIMAWMMDEYSTLVWKYSPWSFTWKPLTSWGSEWRWVATAQWWIYVLEQILKLENDSLKWKKIIIQWAWNAWLTMAKLLVEKEAIIIWISDSRWAIYNSKWIDIKEIETLKKEKSSVVHYEDAGQYIPKDLLTKECDILIPAALENQVTSENANDIKAKYILELANWPVTSEADKILFKNGVIVIPDILANSWWVVVSYFEMVQNNTNYYWELEEVNNKLFDKITKATIDVYNTSKHHETFLRAWAYIIAIKRVFDAMRDRGEV
jgi:glutamate dehydrogenase/leucine dehydrogenase